MPFGKKLQFVTLKYHIPIQVRKNADYYSILTPHLNLDLAKGLYCSLQSIYFMYTFSIRLRQYTYSWLGCQMIIPVSWRLKITSDGYLNVKLKHAHQRFPYLFFSNLLIHRHLVHLYYKRSLASSTTSIIYTDLQNNHFSAYCLWTFYCS